MNILIPIYVFILGLSLGSFALAMVDRMKAKKDWVKGRSKCDSCHKVLKPIDLIPVFSWLSTKGTCRYCNVKLPNIYPIAELSLGLAFLMSYLYWPHDLTGVIEVSMLIVWFFALIIMAALFIYDMRWYLLPTKLMRPLVLLGLVWMVLDIYKQGLSTSIVISYLLSILVASGVFLLLYVLSNGKWIGDGDIRLGVAIGLFAGGPLESWFCIFVASLLGIIVSLPVMLKTNKAKRLKLKIPFGPMLIIGLVITVLVGTQIIDWYKIDVLYL